jgi:ribonuclease HI
MERIIYLYADESCLGNARNRATPGGAGGLVCYWTGERWEWRDYWLAEPATTNNRMAIRSAIEGLRALKAPCRVIFTSDSQYLVKGMREWVHGWIRRGWKRQGGAVENVELWQELVQVAARHQVDWRWVRGHAGHPQNEYADYLATEAARKQSQSGGLIPSRFAEWLEREREKDRYMDYFEFAPPSAEKFRPAPAPR